MVFPGDVAHAVILRQGLDAEDFARMAIDHFDTVYAEGESNGRVMCLAIHPYIMGQPHRARHLDAMLKHICAHADVWHATGSQIADWYYATMWDTVTAHLCESER